MIITTTPSIEGQAIESYLGPISAHVVFGVNIFSDIAASWRDVFGGRSQTYQKQLHRLTSAALADLEHAAKKLRANAIVGLKMDYSEISGGGKAGMFMVVASGTAVLFSKSDQDPSVFLEKIVVAGEKIKMQIERSVFTAEFPDYLITNDTLKKAVELRAHNTFDPFKVRYESSTDINVTDKNDVFSYLEMCIEEKGYRWLLDISLEAPLRMHKYLHELLQSHDDFQLLDLEPYLNGQVAADYVSLLSVCRLSQKHYILQDQEKIRHLATLVPTRNWEVIQVSNKKKLLGGTTEIYLCPCGAEFNFSQSDMCLRCSKNKWGLPGKEGPDDVIKHLISIADALESISD